MNNFKLVSSFKPSGDQPKAIKEIVQGFRNNAPYHTLLGVTGSGKTFTMANIIAELNLPALIISHNKTLAAQLYNEFKSLFPKNAVNYFVSYYDYYQPEAYRPDTDTYIEKDSSINEEIDKLRLNATADLFQRKDVIIVSSVSCIYGLGSPKDYSYRLLKLKKHDTLSIENVLQNLVDINYSRDDFDPSRGKFRVRGDVLEIYPAYKDSAFRIEFFGDEIEKISEIDNVSLKVISELESIAIFPATHFVTRTEVIEDVIKELEKLLKERLKELNKQNKLLEAHRLKSRTKYDMELIQEMGYCSGIENYSRVFEKRAPGTRPYTLLDYFPKDFILFIDESHVTIPQIRAMYNGDRSRKETLVEYGFRLPCALDNRPLKFNEFEKLIKKCVFVSATPSEYEIKKSYGTVVEQIIRPTGLIDPEVIVRPANNQVDDLIGEIQKRIHTKERVMVTTLTKRMAEDLTAYLEKIDIKTRYLHSDIDTIERSDIILDLRKGVFDVLVGINLLREGLDIPEVSLVAILDADKEGFLRSERSLIQTIGRASRNINGRVLLYADKMTDSIKKALNETNRRRSIQEEYNKANKITPKTIVRKLEKPMGIGRQKTQLNKKNIFKNINDALELKKLMDKAVYELEFERAAQIRDRLKELDSLK